MVLKREIRSPLKCLSPAGLVSYMRVSRSDFTMQEQSIYHCFEKGGIPIVFPINDENRYLKHVNKEAIGADESLISFFKQHHIILLVEQVGDFYYRYERQEDGSYDMSNAPYWDAFMLEYGSLRHKE